MEFAKEIDLAIKGFKHIFAGGFDGTHEEA
jgi:hypothetical protein